MKTEVRKINLDKMNTLFIVIDGRKNYMMCPLYSCESTNRGCNSLCPWFSIVVDNSGNTNAMCKTHLIGRLLNGKQKPNDTSRSARVC